MSKNIYFKIKNNLQIDDFFRRKNQNLSVYICLIYVYIYLGDSRALQPQGFSEFIKYKMSVYQVQNVGLSSTKCRFIKYKMSVYKYIFHYLYLLKK